MTQAILIKLTQAMLIKRSGYLKQFSASSLAHF